MKLDKSQRDNIFKYACFFCLAALLCYFFPYTGDDWAWGGSTGIDRFQSGFQGYGGRYIGYLLSIALTRFNLLKTFVMAFTLTAIVFLIQRITEFRYSFSVSCVLLLTVPTVMLRESVVWTSGFANYCFPMATLLLYIDNTKSLFNENQTLTPPRNIWWRCIFTFLLAFVNGLFVEHLTVFSVVFSLFVIIYSYFKYRTWIAQYISYFVGAIFSTVLMFSNAAYAAAANGTDHYRQFAESGIMKRAMYNFIYEFSQNMILNNVFVNLIFLLLFAAVIRRLNQKEHPRVHKVFLLGVSVLSLFWVVSVIQTVVYGLDNKPTNIIYFNCVVALISLCVVLTMILLYFFYVSKSKLLLVLVGSAAVISGPLLAVTPIGSRCFFPVYILWILILCCISKDLFDQGMIRIRKNVAKPLVMLIISVCYALYMYVYISNSAAIEMRVAYCREEIEKGERTIVLEQLPYADWLWSADPGNETYMERFKNFYALPQDVQIVIEK